MPDGSASDRAFDRWLNRQLHGLYDPVLAEPLPDELMRLLDRFEQRPKPSDAEGGDEQKG
jgi:hypothetical protein